MNRKLSDLVGIVAAAVTVAFILDTWSEGAITRGIREKLRAVPVAVAPGRDETVPTAWITALHQEARDIIEGG